MDTPGTEAIQRAEEAGKLNKRQGKALRRLSERVSQATIEHMLGLMGHVTLAKALKDAKEKGILCWNRRCVGQHCTRVLQNAPGKKNAKSS